jgi:hypothetical protein
LTSANLSDRKNADGKKVITLWPPLTKYCIACFIPLHDAGIESPRYLARFVASNTIIGRDPLGLVEDDVEVDVTNLAAVDDVALEVECNNVSSAVLG